MHRFYDDALLITCISDTHCKHSPLRFPSIPQHPSSSNASPSDSSSSSCGLSGDILIHTGDFTALGTPIEISSFIDWLHEQPFTLKILIAGTCLTLTHVPHLTCLWLLYIIIILILPPYIIAPTLIYTPLGNHDMTLHEDYYLNHGHALFHRHTKKPPYDTKECREMLHRYSDIIYLEDSYINLRVLSPTPSSSSSDTVTVTASVASKPSVIKVYGSPWQPEFFGWAFNAQRGPEILGKWRMIPSDVDILLTHGPPYGYGDTAGGERVGCMDLMNELTHRIRPRLHVFGHIHEDAGVWTHNYDPSTITDTPQRSSTKLINACTCDLNYRPTHPPISLKYPLSASTLPSRLDLSSYYVTKDGDST